MKSPATAFFTTILVSVAACAHHAEPVGEQPVSSTGCTLVGQLLLPDGAGSRGVEIMTDVSSSGDEPPVVWVLFDELGHFSHTYQGRLVGVRVSAGLQREVFRIDSGDLPVADRAGRIDVGVIDLREQLVRHRLTVGAAEGAPSGEVKVAMWSGPPPVGPGGEPVALGSRQFPAVTLGSELEWLLPHGAKSIYFLVERPDGPGRGVDWRSGYQRLFGPFVSEEMPAELIMD